MDTNKTSHKILVLDDDPELLELYSDMLGQLPSKPQIFTSNSGARALTMLEEEGYRLLICDLRMPKMDGLQVLSIVRRKYPELRTVALTSVVDEQFRSRVYALGVDLFWHKPSTEQEIKMFLDCLESLLGREDEDGFRGVQSKSLVDIIQMECISQSSSVLRITNGPVSGRIWIQDGEVWDAVAGDLGGEAAFQKILSWRAGIFETLPPEPSRPRVIQKSYNALLLESAQALDESRNGGPPEESQAESPNGETPNGSQHAPRSPLTESSQIEGVEFVLALKPEEEGKREARGLENPEQVAHWTRQTLERLRGLGERLQAGPLAQAECLGPQRHVALAGCDGTEFCVGWRHSMTAEQVRQMMRKVLAVWAS
jgi:CheY-like chemotaxis protein